MDLSQEFCKYLFCQIDKTVKIFAVSFFLNIYLVTCIYCKLETVLFSVYARSFYHSVKHRPENKVIEYKFTK